MGCAEGRTTLALSSLVVILKKLSNSGKETADVVLTFLSLLGACKTLHGCNGISAEMLGGLLGLACDTQGAHDTISTPSSSKGDWVGALDDDMATVSVDWWCAGGTKNIGVRLHV